MIRDITGYTRRGYGREPIQLFGKRWCAHTQMLRRYLDRTGIPYVYRDMERDLSAANQVRWWTGAEINPVLYVDGEVLVEPSLNEVAWTLQRHAIA